MNRTGVKSRRNCEVISGIIHVLKTGCRWQDSPHVYAPHTTVYNRFNCWSKKGAWAKILSKFVAYDAIDVQSIDSTTAKAQRCAAGGKGARRSGYQQEHRRAHHENSHRRRRRWQDHRVRADGWKSTRHWPAAGLIERLPPAKSLLADAAYDSDAFRAFLTGRGHTGHQTEPHA
jgi:transposase